MLCKLTLNFLYEFLSAVSSLSTSLSIVVCCESVKFVVSDSFVSGLGHVQGVCFVWFDLI